MKKFSEFMAEAKISAERLQAAINKKSYTFADLEDKDKKKLTSLYDELAKLKDDPRARTGALAKQITAVDKKIGQFATKFGMTDSEMVKAKR